jgi:hypothetical protein
MPQRLDEGYGEETFLDPGLFQELLGPVCRWCGSEMEIIGDMIMACPCEGNTREMVETEERNRILVRQRALLEAQAHARKLEEERRCCAEEGSRPR